MEKTPEIDNATFGDSQEANGIDEFISSIGVGNLDMEQGVNLKDWSAQDFASIYVRFRPHLISHARKFLREESQAEEVVQDAFLYLMTALPELDSELGVLRFLKWKTRMLALDVLRARRVSREEPIAFATELESFAEPVDESLMRADDAALVNLALSKLAPRHRQVLVESVILERSIESMANDRGISQNAMRQLAYRARRSLRLALIGELEIEGKSLAEVTSLAVRRAARPGVAALGSMAILAVSLNFGSPIRMGETVGTLSSQVEQVVSPKVTSAPDLEIWDYRDPELVNADSQALVIATSGKSSSDANSILGPATLNNMSSEDESLKVASLDLPDASEPEESEIALALSTAFVTFDNPGNRKESWILTEDEVGQRISIETSFGVSAHIGLSYQSETLLQHAFFTIDLGGLQLIAVPQRSLSRLEDRIEGGAVLHYAAVDLLIGDFSGNFNFESLDASEVLRGGISVSVSFDSEGEVVDATLDLSPLG